MEQHWWSADWIKYLIGWIIGIPSGVIANWLYDKIKAWRRKETEFLRTSYSKGMMKFEGQYNDYVPIKGLLEQILKPEEPTSQEVPPQKEGQTETPKLSLAGSDQDNHLKY